MEVEDEVGAEEGEEDENRDKEDGDEVEYNIGGFVSLMRNRRRGGGGHAPGA